VERSGIYSTAYTAVPFSGVGEPVSLRSTHSPPKQNSQNVKNNSALNVILSKNWCRLIQ